MVWTKSEPHGMQIPMLWTLMLWKSQIPKLWTNSDPRGMENSDTHAVDPHAMEMSAVDQVRSPWYGKVRYSCCGPSCYGKDRYPSCGPSQIPVVQIP